MHMNVASRAAKNFRGTVQGRTARWCYGKPAGLLTGGMSVWPAMAGSLGGPTRTRRLPRPSASANASRGGGPPSRHACSRCLVVVSRIRCHGPQEEGRHVQEEGRMCRRRAKRSGERRTTRMLRATAPPARCMRTVGEAPRGRSKAGATGSLQATHTTHRCLPLVQRAAHG